MIEYIRDIRIIDDQEIIEPPAIWELPDCAKKGLCGNEYCCAETVEEMGEWPPFVAKEPKP